MHSQSPVGVTAGQAAGMSVQLKGVCVTDVTIWLWTNRYKVYGAKHFFRTIMQGTVTIAFKWHITCGASIIIS